ncbi:Ish1 domain-containing protein, partial [Cellulomonas sp. A375-1]|uniref:Ish1 domain-containing protein n=1 Tax=Cellulomonas sp. A375-1 TaxID=1672219 RepID=UPI0006527EE7
MAPKIHTPVKGFTGTVAGVTFADGTGETDDEGAIAYFERHGYTIDDEPPAFPDGEPTDAWKVAQLKAYAAAHGIDLGSASNKDEIVKGITDAKAPPA